MTQHLSTPIFCHNVGTAVALVKFSNSRFAHIVVYMQRIDKMFPFSQQHVWRLIFCQLFSNWQFLERQSLCVDLVQGSEPHSFLRAALRIA
jgi:hypothetical protein